MDGTKRTIVTFHKAWIRVGRCPAEIDSSVDKNQQRHHDDEELHKICIPPLVDVDAVVVVVAASHVLVTDGFPMEYPESGSNATDMPVIYEPCSR